ncbi:MAG: hypothetical protein CR996_00805 [Draconibacterium sp.]|nr:MAG: hypothetical protein CR996_00805 [Draconibacterium sp.]
MKKFILISILFITSCHNFKSDYNDYEGFNVLSIDDANKESKLEVSRYVDSITYIPLETDTSCLIGKIKKVELDSKYIYVLDRYSSNSLFVFDWEGNFFKKIGAQGKGPGEYCSAHDFCLLPNDTIVLYDRDCKRLFYYYKFQFVKTKEIEWFSHSIAYDQNRFYFYMQKQYSFNKLYKGNYDLITTTSSLEFLNKLFRYEQSNTMYYDPENIFRYCNDSLIFISRNKDKIYKLKENQIRKAYYLSFGKDNVPYEYTLSIEVFNKYKDDYSYLWNTFLESSRFIFYDADLKGDNYVYYFFYDKKNTEFSYSKLLDNDIDKIFSDFIYSNDSCFVGIVSPIDIIDNQNIITNELSTCLQNLDKMDNPIIAIYHLKR